MKRKTVPTYKAEVVIGTKEGYDGPQHSYDEAKAIVQAYCDTVGFGLQFFESMCIYTSGNEPSLMLSLINYPRFHKEPYEILAIAEELGLRIAKAFNQLRFTIVATDKTVMIELEESLKV